MSTSLAPQETAPELLERVVLGGDLARLQPAERLQYYREVCSSVGLNPLTRPFEYLVLNGKMLLYARRDATDQLRKIHKVSVQIMAREQHGDVYAVTARATDHTGRVDESIGAVSTGGLKGDALANALMKAETKAKRRVTLSLCGLGMLDETEAETVPGAKVVQGEAVPVLPHAEIEPESGRQEMPQDGKVPVNEWVKSFEVVASVKAAQAVWNGFNATETLKQYTPDEYTLVFDAKEAAKVRLAKV